MFEAAEAVPYKQYRRVVLAWLQGTGIVLCLSQPSQTSSWGYRCCGCLAAAAVPVVPLSRL
jgi:hypothetical protein